MRRFLSTLRDTSAPDKCANPYSVFEPGVDARPSAPETRLKHLRKYLSLRRDSARLLLLAEAPGFQGARFTGIPMTSERMLLGRHPHVPVSAVLGPDVRARRTSALAVCRSAIERDAGFSEPTSSIVWQALLAHQAQNDVVLWNVFPFHPTQGIPLSNRTPTRREVLAHLDLLDAFLALFPGRKAVAVGRTAQVWLAEIGRPGPVLRHPANGGATAFRAGFAALMDPME